ncbi:hypothetical protein F6Y05_38205 [Bacillus megaterium]|nr:hypothetical protein [Priestia megaterium]
MIKNKLKFLVLSTFNIIIIFLASPMFVQAKGDSNEKLQAEVTKQILEVVDAWIKIGIVSMLLPIVAGATLMILSATNHRLVQSGKSLVLGSGIVIALLGSSYGIIRIILSIFGL